jgi:predicted ATP-grasp superfamily ATP-dependent carboligase
MIVGGSRSHIPFVDAANAAGFHTVVVDRSDDAPAGKLAGLFQPISTHDQEGLLDLASVVEQERPLVGVLTYASDSAALASVACLTESVGLPGYSKEAVRLTTDKGMMKKSMRRARIPSPDWAVASKRDEAIDFARRHDGPVLVKPVAGTVGSAGVALASTEERVARSFDVAASHSLDSRVLIEAFCMGTEFSVNGIAGSTDLRVLAVCRKLNLGPDRNFIISGFYSVDPSADRWGASSAASVALDAVRCLGIRNSFFAVDVIVGPFGPMVLEVGLLLDAKIDRLLAFSGADVYGSACRNATGQPTFPPGICPEGFALRFMFGPDETSRASPESACSTPQCTVEWEVGPGRFPPQSLADTFGWVLCRADSSEDAAAEAGEIARICGSTLLGDSTDGEIA